MKHGSKDPYYSSGYLGYYGTALSVIIPLTFLLILIFLLLDIINWFVRRALKNRERRRQELKRQGRRNLALDIDKEISNRFIAALIKLLGYFFFNNNKTASSVKQRVDKYDDYNSTSQDHDDDSSLESAETDSDNSPAEMEDDVKSSPVRGSDPKLFIIIRKHHQYPTIQHPLRKVLTYGRRRPQTQKLVVHL